MTQDEWLEWFLTLKLYNDGETFTAARMAAYMNTKNLSKVNNHLIRAVEAGILEKTKRGTVLYYCRRTNKAARGKWRTHSNEEMGLTPYAILGGPGGWWVESPEGEPPECDLLDCDVEPGWGEGPGAHAGGDQRDAQYERHHGERHVDSDPVAYKVWIEPP